MKTILTLLLTASVAILWACSNENQATDTSVNEKKEQVWNVKDEVKTAPSEQKKTDWISKINMNEKLTFSVVNELKGETLTEWSWEAVKNWDKVSVHYLWRFIDGNKFDSSVDRGLAFDFVVWQGKVIRWWEVWLIWMKVWELKRVHIPSAMGYWDNQVWPIPAKSTLIFDIELLKIN